MLIFFNLDRKHGSILDLHVGKTPKYEYKLWKPIATISFPRY